MSGVGDEITEMDELLGAMAEARKGTQGNKSVEKKENRRKEAEKERMGKEMVARSLVRKTENYSEVKIDVGTQGEKEEPVFRKRPFNGNLRGGMVGELFSFKQALKASDVLRVEVKQERLVL